MNCAKAQELILTDYMDGEITKPLQNDLEDHLLGCPACREFFAVSKASISDLLQTAGQKETPEYVWHRLKDKIVHKQTSANRKKPLIQYAPSLFWFPNPYWSFVSVLSLIIIVSVALHLRTGTLDNTGMLAKTDQNTTAESNTLNNDISELAYLMGYGQTHVESGATGYGTSIEEYFL